MPKIKLPLITETQVINLSKPSDDLKFPKKRRAPVSAYPRQRSKIIPVSSEPQTDLRPEELLVDREPDVAIEQHFILRLPESLAKSVRRDMREKDAPELELRFLGNLTN